MKGNVRKRSIWLLFLSFMLVTISLTKTSPTHEEVVNILRIAIGGVAILFFITDVIFTVLNR
ncbi:hypothetical protein, partial [Escherichia coli]